MFNIPNNLILDPLVSIGIMTYALAAWGQTQNEQKENADPTKYVPMYPFQGTRKH